MIKKILDKLFNKEEHLECAIDDESVDCKELVNDPLEYIEPYVGVACPVELKTDAWFGPPVKTEKQLEREEQMKIEEQSKPKVEKKSKEPDNIHEVMYNLATKNQNTTIQLNPPGGSENFQSGPGGWNSGTGQNQFR